MYTPLSRQAAVREVSSRRAKESTFTTPLLNPKVKGSKSERELDDIKTYLLQFYRTIYQRQEECTQVCETYPDTVAKFYSTLVPKRVTHEDFWQRYFYRCDPDRVMTEWVWKQQEQGGSTTPSKNKGSPVPPPPAASVDNKMKDDADVEPASTFMDSPCHVWSQHHHKLGEASIAHMVTSPTRDAKEVEIEATFDLPNDPFRDYGDSNKKEKAEDAANAIGKKKKPMVVPSKKKMASGDKTGFETTVESVAISALASSDLLQEPPMLPSLTQSSKDLDDVVLTKNNLITSNEKEVPSRAESEDTKTTTSSTEEGTQSPNAASIEAATVKEAPVTTTTTEEYLVNEKSGDAKPSDHLSTQQSGKKSDEGNSDSFIDKDVDESKKQMDSARISMENLFGLKSWGGSDTPVEGGDDPFHKASKMSLKTDNTSGTSSEAAEDLDNSKVDEKQQAPQTPSTISSSFDSSSGIVSPQDPFESAAKEMLSKVDASEKATDPVSKPDKVATSVVVTPGRKEVATSKEETSSVSQENTEKTKLSRTPGRFRTPTKKRWGFQRKSSSLSPKRGQQHEDGAASVSSTTSKKSLTRRQKWYELKKSNSKGEDTITTSAARKAPPGKKDSATSNEMKASTNQKEVKPKEVEPITKAKENQETEVAPVIAAVESEATTEHVSVDEPKKTDITWIAVAKAESKAKTEEPEPKEAETPEVAVEQKDMPTTESEITWIPVNPNAATADGAEEAPSAPSPEPVSVASSATKSIGSAPSTSTTREVELSEIRAMTKAATNPKKGSSLVLVALSGMVALVAIASMIAPVLIRQLFGSDDVCAPFIGELGSQDGQFVAPHWLPSSSTVDLGSFAFGALCKDYKRTRLSWTDSTTKGRGFSLTIVEFHTNGEEGAVLLDKQKLVSASIQEGRIITNNMKGKEEEIVSPWSAPVIE